MIPILIKALAIGLFVGSAAYIHLRGRVRHRLVRQLTDHSTFLAPYNTLMAVFSAVPRKRILDVNDFPELRVLRDNWRTIRAEAEQLDSLGSIRDAKQRNDVAFNSFFRRGWTRFYVKWYGDAPPSARTLCPKTVALVESIPSVNAALFAKLMPHAVLGEHRDPFGGSLRYHLGLKTPNSDACRIYIDGIPYSWRDGEDIVFDETFIHSVNNDTDETRLIFFCDIARPLRNPLIRALNRFVTRRIVKMTAAQNTDAEDAGILSGLAGTVYSAKLVFEKLKRQNRTLYYMAKYTALAALAYTTLR